MWGDNYRKWFDLFAGIVVYRATEDAPGNDEGWVNVNEYEKMFSSDRLTFNGRPYTPSDTKQRNKLLEAILNNAGALCAVKLLERRRRIAPPSLDYRVTKFGRRVDAWGYGDKPGIRKRLFFFGVEAFFRLKKHWRLVTIGAACWGVINAIRFYGAALEWIRGDVFVAITALGVAVLIWLGALLGKGSSH